MPGRRNTIPSQVAYVLLCGFFYWLIAARPLVAQPWQWADDGLYLKQGELIAAWICHPVGPWLGPYDPIILAKPPAFGIWLALVHLAGIPLRVAEFGILLALPFIFRRAVAPVAKIQGWRFFAVTILLVGLPNLAIELRLLRSSLNAAVAGGALITTLGLTLRANDSVRTQIKWAAMLGLFYACSFMNREESIWLLPGIVVALATTAVVLWRGGRRLLALSPTATAVAVALTLIGGVCLLNELQYGFFATSTRRCPGIIRLYETLTSLEPEGHERLVPVRTETRLHAYKLSPELARLQPYLDGPPGDEFARNEIHNYINDRPKGTREFYGSDFQYALIRAAAYAGAHNARAADDLFGRAADELQLAIRQNKIHHGMGGSGFSNAPMPGDFLRVLRALKTSVGLLLSVQGIFPDPKPVSSGAPVDLQRMSDLSNTNLAPTSDIVDQVPNSPAQGIRSRCFMAFEAFLRIVYPASVVALLASICWILLFKRSDRYALLICVNGMIVLGSLLTFCSIISVFDVLAARTLEWPQSYNSLGFTPLSILSAYSIAAAAFAMRHITNHNGRGAAVGP